MKPIQHLLKIKIELLMKRYALLLTLIVLMTGLTQTTSAQYYFYNDDYYDNPVLFEVGGSLNIMNSLTDIGGKKGIGGKFIKDLNIGKTSVGAGAYFSALYKNAIGIRLEGAFGKVSGSDDVLIGIDDIAKERYNRNLNYRSTITEFSILTELHPLFIFIDWAGRDADPPRLSPYFVGGVGFFTFNPQGQIGGRWVDLQPLSTEGQGFAEYPDRPVYKLKQMNIPLGLGIKYELSSLVNMRGEFVYRKLSTDYLDDVSRSYIDPTLYSNYFSGAKLENALLMNDRQLIKKAGVDGKRGSPVNNDSYFSFNLKFGIIIGRERIR